MRLFTVGPVQMFSDIVSQFRGGAAGTLLPNG